MLRIRVSSRGLLPLAMIALSLSVPAVMEASHFRYGHLVWTREGGVGSRTASIKLYGAFRRTGYSGTDVDGRPKVGDIITETIGATGINFGDGASTGTLRFYVLSIDPAANWIYGVSLANSTTTDPNVPLLHTYSTDGPWIANINACCRISNSFNAADDSYRLETIIDFAKAASSPTSTLPIIVNCAANSTCTFPIPGADSENRLLRWRVATPTESFLTVGANLPLSVNAVTGLASFIAPNVVGRLYSAQVVIEKLDPNNPANLLSKSSVDFLIQLVQGLPAGQPPAFQAPTPTCGQQVTLQPGQQISFTISARSNNNPTTSVTLNVIGAPPGSTFAPVLPVAGNPTVSSLFSFTAATGGNYSMNFTATDGGLQTTCGYSIIVPTANTVVSLSAIRGGSFVRLQTKIAGTLCGSPTFALFRRTGGSGAFSQVGSPNSTGAFAASLIGPAGTLNEFYVVMSLAGACAPPSQSNTVSLTF